MLGVKKAYIIDAKKEFADNYVAKAIKANAMYEDSYPLSTAIARPLQAEWGVKIAIKEKADAIAHGCTGKGNDQVRFDGTIMTLAPFLKIIAPIRNRSMHRDDEIAYAMCMVKEDKHMTRNNLLPRLQRRIATAFQIMDDYKQKVHHQILDCEAQCSPHQLII